MTMPVIYFNEHDPFAAAWLRLLCPHSQIDERSIVDVTGTDVSGPRFKRVHFFGGIGGWEYALQLAGWPRAERVWTGSCPCQPFSCAGKQRGTADERHLWPQFCRLIGECRPSIVFGEQVASKAGREWLAGVRTDLEALGYAVGAADLCAAGVGSPHIRQRLYWVAHAERGGCGESGSAGWSRENGEWDGINCGSEVENASSDGRLAHAHLPDEHGRTSSREQSLCHSSSKISRLGDSPSRGLGIDGSTCWSTGHADESGEADGMEHAQCSGLSRESLAVMGTGNQAAWSRYDLIPCLDGKTRRIESGTFPLAHGVPNRVGLLRGYGNAIVPQVAATFVRAFMEVVGMEPEEYPQI